MIVVLLLVSAPAAAEDPTELFSANTNTEQNHEDAYRFPPAERPVLQAHLGIGSGYQAGLGAERFRPWILLPRGFVERGTGVEVVSEWDRTGFKNLSMLGRWRVFAMFMFPSIFGLDIFAGAVTTGEEIKGIGGYSLHVGMIYFDFGYRYQRAILPWSSPDWLGRHFFFVRFACPIGK